MEFPVVMRGYAREEVEAFLTGVADQIAERDARIAQLDVEIARCRQELAGAPAQGIDRTVLLRHLGEEAASILTCADAAAERMKAQAGLSAERVRHDLRTIGSSLVDVHQFLGELVSLVQGLTEGTALMGAPPEEVRLPEACETSAPAGSLSTPAAVDTQAPEPPSAPAEAGVELRTVLGEVLGLERNARPEEIRVPDETEVTGPNPAS